MPLKNVMVGWALGLTSVINVIIFPSSSLQEDVDTGYGVLMYSFTSAGLDTR